MLGLASGLSEGSRLAKAAQHGIAPVVRQLVQEHVTQAQVSQFWALLAGAPQCAFSATYRPEPWSGDGSRMPVCVHFYGAGFSI